MPLYWIAFIFFLVTVSHGAAQPHWVASWGCSMSTLAKDPSGGNVATINLKNKTLRQVLRLSAPGSTIRIELSNVHNEFPISIGEVHLAMSSGGCSIVASKDKRLTFHGKSSFRISPHSRILSDPIHFQVPPLAQISISIYFPEPARNVNFHLLASQSAYIVEGNQTAVNKFNPSETLNSWILVSRVDVSSPNTFTIVALGDSLTDGYGSTMNANHRYTDFLAGYLNSKAKYDGVLNEGISGNRLLHDVFGLSGLARFNDDVLRQPQVKYVIVLLGINDLGFPETGPPLFKNQLVSTAQIVNAYKMLIEKAHKAHIKIFGVTLLPYRGAYYFTDNGEKKRQMINHWIRTKHTFDAVIDFDRAVCDPNEPSQLNPLFDSSDHLHPNDAGYEAMAKSIPLTLFSR